MEIQYTPAVALKHGHPVNRFVVESELAERICASMINTTKVSDSSITCKDEILTWHSFLEHHGKDKVVYEIPEKYSDAFYLYLKTIKVWVSKIEINSFAEK